MRSYLAAAALLIAARVYADNPGTTAAPVLEVPLGARALGMGAAFTAVADDESALQYNPAGLSQLSAHEIGFTYIVGAGQTSLQNLDWGGPLAWGGISGLGFASAGASLLLSQSGSIQVNTLNTDGSLASSQNLNAGSDIVLSGGYSERFAASSFQAPDRMVDIDHAVGISAKYLHSTILQSYHSDTFAGDFGYLVRAPEEGLAAGLAVLNFGQSVTYVSQSDPLPTTARAGFSWRKELAQPHSLIVGVDGDYVPTESAWHANVGFEYAYDRMYFARMGYRINRPDQGGLTLGLGMLWQGKFQFDYAIDVGDLLGDAHRVTISYRFGEVETSQRGRARSERAPYTPKADNPLDRWPGSPTEPAPAAAPTPVPHDKSNNPPGWIY